MKKIGLFSLFGILFFSLTGCEKDFSEKALPEETLIQETTTELNYQNDFKELDRSLINWTITFDECIEKIGGSTSEQGEAYLVKKCNDGLHEQEKREYQHNDRIDPEYHKIFYYENNEYTFSLDREKNGKLISIFDEVKMPNTYQNSLIELFALTGEAITYKTPSFDHSQDEKINNEKIGFLSQGEDFDISFSGGQLLISKRKEMKYGDFLLVSANGTKQHFDLFDYEEGENTISDVLPQRFTDFLLHNLGKNVSFKIQQEVETGNDENTQWLRIDTNNQITFNHLTYEDLGYQANLCTHWMCFDADTPIQYYKGRYYQKVPEDPEVSKILGEQDTILLYNEELNLGISYNQGFEGTNIAFFIDNKNESVDVERNVYCMGQNISQKAIKKSDFQIPETLTFFGETYQLQDFQNTIELGLTTSNEYGYVETIINLFTSPEEAENIITKSIEKTNQIYNTYLLKFEQYPNLFFTYTNINNTKNSQAILQSDEIFKLDENGNLMDKNQTITVLCALGLNDFHGECQRKEGEYPLSKTIQPLFFFDETKEKQIDYQQGEHSREKTAILNEKMLPLFTIKESPKKGYYYIFPAEGVVFDAGGAGCKPVIYVYDSLARENSVSVTLPEFARFTKVIPDFSSFPTWNFTSNAQSEITVDEEQYPYLYYSTLWKHYQDNHYGWTVAYEDIPAFLENKLDYMNFSEKEKSDFLEYWLPEFQPGFVYSISFKFNEEFEPYAKLDFSTQPEQLFRMFMEAHQLPLGTSITYSSEKPDAWNHLLLKKTERTGDLIVIERGGKLDKWTK